MLLYDISIEESFYHIFDFLLLCGQNGITINPKKLQFCEKEVEFIGYSVRWDGYRPSDNMISAIENFPNAERTIIDRYTHLVWPCEPNSTVLSIFCSDGAIS